MRKKTTRILFCAVAVLVASGATPSWAATAAFCAARWPGDSVMQRRCLHRQGLASLKVGKFEDRHRITQKIKAEQIDGPYIKMYYLCVTRWKAPKFRSYDMVMLARCFAKQEKAYKSMR